MQVITGGPKLRSEKRQCAQPFANSYCSNINVQFERRFIKADPAVLIDVLEAASPDY